MGDEEEVVEEHAVGTGLDPYDGLPVEAGALREGLLRDGRLQAGRADAVADGAALVEDPGGGRLWRHAATLSRRSRHVSTVGGTGPHDARGDIRCRHRAAAAHP
ncbi:predicted protein [Streptomyces sp. SPB78]|nr:predicted protein [Streptomyces sp. SPB78]